MSDSNDKTKTTPELPTKVADLVYVNPFEDYAIVQQFYTDDGLFDGEAHAELEGVSNECD